MYVYLKFGENWTTNMEDMAKTQFLQLFFLSFFFFSLNPSISKTVKGTGLKFCTQVGSDDPTCNDLSKCLYTMLCMCKQQQCTLVRASVDALCRDGAGQISRERVQRGRLTRQGTRS